MQRTHTRFAHARAAHAIHHSKRVNTMTRARTAAVWGGVTSPVAARVPTTHAHIHTTHLYPACEEAEAGRVAQHTPIPTGRGAATRFHTRCGPATPRPVGCAKVVRLVAWCRVAWSYGVLVDGAGPPPQRLVGSVVLSCSRGGARMCRSGGRMCHARLPLERGARSRRGSRARSLIIAVVNG